MKADIHWSDICRVCNEHNLYTLGTSEQYEEMLDTPGVGATLSVNQLMELMIHSLYSNRDIFLRELIANAADAIDKAHFASLTDQSLARDWKIRLDIDSDTATLYRSICIDANGLALCQLLRVERNDLYRVVVWVGHKAEIRKENRYAITHSIRLTRRAINRSLHLIAK